MFRQVASSADFVEVWGTDVVSNSNPSDRRQSEPLSTSGDQPNRKRPASPADTALESTSNPEETLGAPPSSKKQCDYMNKGIDQRIEKCRKGNDIMSMCSSHNIEQE